MARRLAAAFALLINTGWGVEAAAQAPARPVQCERVGPVLIRAPRAPPALGYRAAAAAKAKLS